MSDNLFPSGPWTGFYNYGPASRRHRMDVHFTFVNGRLSGEGSDDIGRFVITGSYDASEGECSWTKTYPGSHSVRYRGFREGKGIWGTWEIGLMAHGGFHLWPRQSGEGEAKKRAAAETTPAIVPCEDPVSTVPQSGRAEILEKNCNR